MIRYRFKTKSVEDCRPLVDLATIGMPWWCTGYAADGSYAIIVCYLPEMVNLKRYWDDAYDITAERCEKITYSSRFPKPAWLIDGGCVMEIKHRGYIFRQSDYNYHVRAFQDGHMVFHANVSNPMNEQELLKYADRTVDLLDALLEQEEN